MVVFRYLWFIFRDSSLTCISERLNRCLSNLFIIRMKTRSCRFVKVTDIRRGGIAIENEHCLLQVSGKGDINTCSGINVVSAEKGRQFSHERTWCRVEAMQPPFSSRDVLGAGDGKIWGMELAVDSRPSPSILAGEETTTEGCVGV